MRGTDVFTEGSVERYDEDEEEELNVGRLRCLNERIPSVGSDNPVLSSDLIEVGGAADAPPLLAQEEEEEEDDGDNECVENEEDEESEGDGGLDGGCEEGGRRGGVGRGGGGGRGCSMWRRSYIE